MELLNTMTAMFLNDGLLLGSLTAKAWYLVPLIIAISLVYGGTRHEIPKEILAHSIRSAGFLAVFLSIIFVFIWFSGFGTESAAMSLPEIHFLLAVLAWVFGTLWIAGHAAKVGVKSAASCVLSGGFYAVYFSYQNRQKLMFPLVVMIAAFGWAVVSFFLA